MEQKVIIQSTHAPQAIGAYSQAINVIKTQEMLFISGQLPINPQTNTIISDPAQATKQCMLNIQTILAEATMTVDNIVDITIFLTDIKDFTSINDAYASFFTQKYPARTTVQVAALPKGACIEIKAIACK